MRTVRTVPAGSTTGFSSAFTLSALGAACGWATEFAALAELSGAFVALGLFVLPVVSAGCLLQAGMATAKNKARPSVIRQERMGASKKILSSNQLCWIVYRNESGRRDYRKVSTPRMHMEYLRDGLRFKAYFSADPFPVLPSPRIVSNPDRWSSGSLARAGGVGWGPSAAAAAVEGWTNRSPACERNLALFNSGRPSEAL